jgi:hypothetical protein
MALINKTGITNGGIVQAEHITRAIDALSGGSTDSIIATGSLMGSSSYALTASYALNAAGGTPESASYAATASTLIVANNTSGTGPHAILLATGLGATKLVATDSSDFAFNPIANTLTVARISGNSTTTTASVEMTASFAVSASRATSASIALRLQSSSSFTYHGEGTMYAGDFVTADLTSQPASAAVRAITILINGEEYTIYAYQTS